MVDWPVLALRDAGVRLIDCVHKTPAARETGYPYVGIPQMKAGRIEFGSARRISHEDFVEWTKKAKPRIHDVILSRRTNPGVTAIDRTGREFALGQNLVLLRADGNRVEPAFLKWLVRTPAWWRQIDKFMNVGAVFNSLKCADVPYFELPIPPLESQRRMGGLLDALDDKIDVNRRMNETLESMARTIFKDWFVDFGPTRAKAEGREPYLALELWNLFPDVLDDEDKPEKWHYWTIAYLAVHHRATVAPFENPEQEFEHFSIPAFDAGQYPVLDNGASIKSRKTAIPANAVLLSKLNPNIPRVWIPNPPNGLPQVASTEFLAFTPKSPATCSLLYCLFRDAQFRREMEAMVTGTSKSHQRVSPKALVRRRVLAGATDAFKQFDRQASSLLSRVLRNRVESRTLAQTRDILLPKLMSGEIRLSEAENAVEAVA